MTMKTDAVLSKNFPTFPADEFAAFRATVTSLLDASPIPAESMTQLHDELVAVLIAYSDKAKYGKLALALAAHLVLLPKIKAPQAHNMMVTAAEAVINTIELPDPTAIPAIKSALVPMPIEISNYFDRLVELAEDAAEPDDDEDDAASAPKKPTKPKSTATKPGKGKTKEATSKQDAANSSMSDRDKLYIQMFADRMEAFDDAADALAPGADKIPLLKEVLRDVPNLGVSPVAFERGIFGNLASRFDMRDAQRARAEVALEKTDDPVQALQDFMRANFNQTRLVKYLGLINNILVGDKGNRDLPAIVFNVEKLMELYCISARFNEFTGKPVFYFNGVKLRSPHSKQDFHVFDTLISAAKYGRMSTTGMGEYLLMIAKRDRFNPMAEWQESLSWDGTCRLDKLFSSITVTNGFDVELKNEMMLKFFSRASLRWRSPVFVPNKVALILRSENNTGKSKYFPTLLPSYLREDMIKPDGHFDPSQKDDVIVATSYALFELAELDGTLRKADAAKMKSFLSRPDDTVRAPYAREAETKLRRTIFVGSVNGEAFLKDDTGNVRYWTLDVESINLEWAADDAEIEQVWAQIVHLSKSSAAANDVSAETWRKINDVNEGFRQKTSVEDLLIDTYDWDAPVEKWGLNDRGVEQLSNATEITAELVGTEGMQAKLAVNQIKRALQTLFLGKFHTSYRTPLSDGRMFFRQDVRGYRMPPLRITRVDVEQEARGKVIEAGERFTKPKPRGAS